MKKLIFLAILIFAPLALAQEHAPAAEGKAAAHEGEHAGDPYLTWKLVNFGVLAGALGYLLVKTLPGYFRSRTEEIRKSLEEATEARKRADERTAEIERRLASLGTAIEKLRTDSKEEMEHEAARTRERTERTLAKVQAQAEQEIVSASKHARSDLKNYAAKLALEIAEQRIRAGMTAQSQSALVDGFVKDLEQNHVRREAQ